MSIIGIDKTIIRNIKVNSIDFDILRKNNAKIHYGFADDGQGYKIGEQLIEHLFIEDNFLFYRFIISYVLDKGQKLYYTELNLTLNTKENSEDNTKPLTVDGYFNKIGNVCSYMLERYGIELNFSDARMYKIEVNRTIETDIDFMAYDTILNQVVLNANRNKYRKFVKIGDLGGSNETLELRSDRQRLKIYNKTLQLSETFQIHAMGNKMRFEYVLKDYDKISNSLGSDQLLALDQKVIEAFFIKEVSEDIVGAIEKGIEKSNKKLSKLYRDVKKSMKRGYLRAYYNKACIDELVIDKEQLDIITHKEMALSGNYRKNRKILDEIVPPKLCNNFNKFDELKTKLFDGVTHKEN